MNELQAALDDKADAILTERTGGRAYALAFAWTAYRCQRKDRSKRRNLLRTVVREYRNERRADKAYGY